jgi:hypothetical protein
VTALQAKRRHRLGNDGIRVGETEESHMIRIVFPVGYRAKNAKRDVDKIHDILNKIPPMQGGAPIYIPPNTPYSPELTDIHILSFQNKWFKGNNCDAVVSPGGATLRKMNELARPSDQNRFTMNPEKVLAIMSDLREGSATIKGYSREKFTDPRDGKTRHKTPGLFSVPLYILKVGRDAGDGQTIVEGTESWYHVLRFGVCFHPTAQEAGKHFSEWFSIEGPPCDTFVLKRNKYLNGSWLLRGDFLIHTGPDIGREPFGSLGCIQPVNGGMRRLDENVRKLSFGDRYKSGIVQAREADERISTSGSFRCIVEPAQMPIVRCLMDFSAVNGPRLGSVVTRRGTGF